MTTVPDAPAGSPDGPRGIGGWLILPAIGTFLGPVLWGFYGLSAAMTLTAMPADAPLTALIVMEAIGNLALFALNLWALFLLAGRRRGFPRAFIIVAVGGFVLAVVDGAWAMSLLGESVAQPAWQQIIRSAIFPAVWVPYMLVSRRVRNTFIR
ncbi:DUF2569 domain-containing protein [Zavarzinia sp. CC-PAN008]|uniref:DUF2569 domain-containing protein n=1 Tax=Zavarzinia sp. CC-PAN008 TaxID=3243332 RepID=UPI003F742A22